MQRRIQQSRKATKTLNSLLWSKYISVSTKKRTFCTVIEIVLSYGWEIWTLDYELKEKLLSTEMDL